MLDVASRPGGARSGICREEHGPGASVHELTNGTHETTAPRIARLVALAADRRRRAARLVLLVPAGKTATEDFAHARRCGRGTEFHQSLDGAVGASGALASGARSSGARRLADKHWRALSRPSLAWLGTASTQSAAAQMTGEATTRVVATQVRADWSTLMGAVRGTFRRERIAGWRTPAVTVVGRAE